MNTMDGSENKGIPTGPTEPIIPTQPQPMGQTPASGIEFQEVQRDQQLTEESQGKIVSSVMKYSGGLVKSEKQANYVLVGIIVLAVILALFTFFLGSASPDDLEGTQYDPFEGYGGRELPDNVR